MPIVKHSKSDPTTLTLPQRRINSPQKVQGGNRNPKHIQYRHPVANNLPCKPDTTKKTKHNEEKTEIENVPNVNWENGVENHNAVTVTTRVLPTENPRASLKSEDMQKVEEKALPEKTQKEKCKRKEQSAIYSKTSLSVF